MAKIIQSKKLLTILLVFFFIFSFDLICCLKLFGEKLTNVIQIIIKMRITKHTTQYNGQPNDIIINDKIASGDRCLSALSNML